MKQVYSLITLKVLLLSGLIHVISLQAFSQSGSGIIQGVIKHNGEPIPFANIGIKSSGFGATSDENGRFIISGLSEGTYHVQVTYIGYEDNVKQVTIQDVSKPVNLIIELKPALKNLDEFVVTGTRYEKRKLDSAIPVNVLDRKTLDATQSQTLSDGLVFQPGIRVEKDCQTCNYTQVRMNGMPGSYTQILIDSKPLFSSLAGLYGLEQIPASMLEKVEVVKGGGSVLYGSSAIAGTINIITRDPVNNTIELNSTGSLIDGESTDLQTDLFASVISKNKKAGASLIVSNRERESWDANNDGFSELPQLENLSFAVNSFYKPSKSGKLKIGLNKIHEIRNGGDQLDKEPHLRLQSEYRKSDIFVGTLDYTHQLYEWRTNISVYGGWQQTIREHYTGSYGADGYGDSDNETFIAGTQISYTLLNFISGKNILTAGAEYQVDDVLDQIEAYNYLIDQQTFQSAVFVQSDWDIIPKVNLVTGIRFSDHNKVNKMIASPRISLLYKLNNNFQIRGSRSNGFRAPQAFDADMHIAFSGGGIALTEIDPDLKSEKSVSYNFSVDYNRPFEKYIYGFTVSAFYNKLKNTFILVENDAAGGTGQTILTRTNGSGAVVKGITAEARFNYNYKLEGDLGVTWQESRYDEAVFWSAEADGSENFLRTPDAYGYFTLTYSLYQQLKFSLSGTYTGSMDVPHFGGAPGVEGDVMVQTESFTELNFKAEWSTDVFNKLLKMSLSAGIQNLFNAYQNDFDRGPNRDSNYIYGPGKPRTFFAGLKLVPNRL